MISSVALKKTQIRTETALVTFPTMEDQTNNEIEAVEKGLEKMENEGVLNGSDFTKPWRSSDVIFLVDEQRFYVHRWVLAMWSPVFEKMFTSNFSERKETEISFPNKASAEFKEILVMVYSCAESPAVTNGNCFFLLKLAHEYQIDCALRKCEHFLWNASYSVVAGCLHIKDLFPFFKMKQFKDEKEQILSLLIVGQEYQLERVVAACVHLASYFTLKALKQDYVELCDLITKENYCRILERMIERLEDSFFVF